MADVIAKVTVVSGNVTVRDAEGDVRTVEVGDEIRAGDVLIPAGGVVTLEFTDGTPMAVFGQDEVTVTEDMAEGAAAGPDAAAVAPATVEDIIAALEAGEDLDALLEATAAGTGGAGGEGGGSSFVMLSRIDEGVVPVGYAFGRFAALPPEIEAQLDTVETVETEGEFPPGPPFTPPGPPGFTPPGLTADDDDGDDDDDIVLTLPQNTFIANEAGLSAIASLGLAGEEISILAADLAGEEVDSAYVTGVASNGVVFNVTSGGQLLVYVANESGGVDAYLEADLEDGEPKEGAEPVFSVTPNGDGTYTTTMNGTVDAYTETETTEGEPSLGTVDFDGTSVQLVTFSYTGGGNTQSGKEFALYSGDPDSPEDGDWKLDFSAETGQNGTVDQVNWSNQGIGAGSNLINADDNLKVEVYQWDPDVGTDGDWVLTEVESLTIQFDQLDAAKGKNPAEIALMDLFDSDGLVGDDQYTGTTLGAGRDELYTVTSGDGFHTIIFSLEMESGTPRTSDGYRIKSFTIEEEGDPAATVEVVRTYTTTTSYYDFTIPFTASDGDESVDFHVSFDANDDGVMHAVDTGTAVEVVETTTGTETITYVVPESYLNNDGTDWLAGDDGASFLEYYFGGGDGDPDELDVVDSDIDESTSTEYLLIETDFEDLPGDYTDSDVMLAGDEGPLYPPPELQEPGEDEFSGTGSDYHLYGGSGDDVLIGGAGEDYLVGGDGDDLLFGADGDDTLVGGDGVDVLVGGEGEDVLEGGEDGDLEYEDLVPEGELSIANDEGNLVVSETGEDPPKETVVDSAGAIEDVISELITTPDPPEDPDP